MKSSKIPQWILLVTPADIKTDSKVRKLLVNTFQEKYLKVSSVKQPVKTHYLLLKSLTQSHFFLASRMQPGSNHRIIES